MNQPHTVFHAAYNYLQLWERVAYNLFVVHEPAAYNYLRVQEHVAYNLIRVCEPAAYSFPCRLQLLVGQECIAYS